MNPPLKKKALPKKSTTVIKHPSRVTRRVRAQIFGQKGCVLWLTGLSGSGKSTVAFALEEHLVRKKHQAFVLDGDNLRHGLNKDLGFSPRDRSENIRRVAEVAGLFADSGVIAIVAFISPIRTDRDRARESIGTDRFFEIFMDVPLAVAEERDPKGLYKKARAGEIESFTGITAPYENPINPAMILRTDTTTLEGCVAELEKLLASRGMLSA